MSAVTLTPGATAQPVGFTLHVPQHWYELDLWRATRTGGLARLVDARIAEVPQLAGRRGQLLRYLRTVAADAERHGAVYCAGMAELVPGAGQLVATAMAFQTAGPPDPAQRTVEAIAAQLTSRADDGSGHWREVRLVDVAAGRAVQVRAVEAADLGQGRTTDCAVLQTLLPCPGNQTVLALVLTSPQVQLALPMLDLFEAISETLAWTGSPAGGPEGGTR